MVGQKYRSHTGLVRSIVGHAKRQDDAPALVVREDRRGEFVMTVANFKRWIKERRCVLVQEQEAHVEQM